MRHLRGGIAALTVFISCTEPPPVRHTAPLLSVEAPPPTSAVAAPAASASGDPISSAGPDDAPSATFVAKKVSLKQGAMGTIVTIVAFTSPERDERAVGIALSKAFREIVRLEKLMSTWVSDSEVSRINQEAGKSAVIVGPETLAVIDKSLWIAKESGGLFDITFEAMKGVWKFDDGAVPAVPPKKAIDDARRLIDFRQIELNAKASTIELKRATTRINLGGIAKGYAVDAAARVLDAEGIPAFFVQAGGDLFVRGHKPDGSKFRVGVRDPRGASETDYFALMEVEDHAFSTAGDYERAFVIGNKRYHHIIDPRTGYPATASRSVTVWAKDALTADAIDDAVFILGPKKGMALVDKIEGAGAVIVDAKNRVTISKLLQDKVQVLRDPTDAP